MTSGIPLFPFGASTMASRVDALYLFLIAVTVFFSLLIAGLIVKSLPLGVLRWLVVVVVIYAAVAMLRSARAAQVEPA